MQGLFFDCRYIRIEHHDGISRFSAGLFSALSKLTEVTAIVSDLRQLEKLPNGTKFVKVSAPTSILEPLVALQINKVGAKVVFSPMQTIGSLGRKFKLVLTVHDLIYYRHPAPPPGFSMPIRALWRLYHLVFWPQRLLLNRADAVATVSETTRELITQNRLTKRPVRVIHNAADDIQQVAAATHRPAGHQSLVYMGSFMDYKNVEVLIQGMGFLPGYELNLLSRVSNDRKRQLESLVPQGAKVIFHNGVSESDYHKLLSDSVALVSGSQDEGFGIPLVEAMGRGIPVVISEIAIFREIAGSAGIYFDQNNPASFADAVKSIGENAIWLKNSKAAQEQAAKFSWSRSAEKLLETLKQI